MNIGETLYLAAILIISSVFAFLILQNYNQFFSKTSLITKKTGKLILTTLDLVDYGIKNNILYIYLKPENTINLSNIKVFINGKKATIREVGNGDGIVTKDELIEVTFSPVNDVKIFNLFVSGKRVVPSSWEINIETGIVHRLKVCTRFDWHFPYHLCRMPINITSVSKVNDFQLNLSIDTQTLISQGKLRPDCGDLRFTALYPYEGSDSKDGIVLGYHFDEGSGNITFDYSGYNNNGSIYNATWEPGKFNLALNFSREGYILINYSPSLLLNNSFSVVLWIKPIDNLSNKTAINWWNCSWKYRIPITIQENSGNDLQDYQVNLTIDTQSLILAGKMRSDCGDIRFTYLDPNTGQEIEIPYWIESGCNTTSTKIWIKVPYIPANGQVTVYMYYGNPLASSVSDPDGVFVFFDHFDSSILNTTKWNTTNAGTYALSNSWVTFGGNWSNKILATNISFNLPVRVRAKIRLPKDYINYTYYGGINRDSFVSVLVDNGSVIVGGYIDSNTTGSRDALLLFYNSSNLSLQQEYGFGGADFDTLFSLSKISSGYYAAVGYEESDLFTQGWRSSYRDGLIILFDNAGNYNVWHYGELFYYTSLFSSNYSSYSNQLYVAGEAWTGTSSDLLVAAIDPTTQTVNWDSLIDTGGSEYAYDIVSDIVGGVEQVYVVGGLVNTSRDGIILALDSLGNVLWSYIVGGANMDELLSVTVDDQGYLYVLGHENSTTTGDLDMFVAKIAPNGTLIWQKAYSTPLDDCAWGRIKYYNGYLYIACDVWTKYLAGNHIALIMKVDTNGNIIWQKYLRGDGNSTFNDITIDNNYLYIVGRENINSYGDNDGILIKINLSSIPNYTVYFDDGFKLYFTNANLTSYNTTLSYTSISVTSSIADFSFSTLTWTPYNPNLNHSINYSDYSVYITFNTTVNSKDFIAFGTLTKNITIDFAGYRQTFPTAVSVFKNHTIEAIFTSRVYKATLDDKISYSITSLNTYSQGYIGIGGMSESQMDWIAICKYVSPEPSISYGLEEQPASILISKKGQFGIFAGNSTIFVKVGNKILTYPFVLNVWQSIIIVYDNITKMLSLYINGNLVGSSQTNNTPTTNNVTIGFMFKGLIDEVRIYNRALSSDEVRLIGLGILEKNIPYYIEEGTCNTNNTVVFVRLPILTNETIYMYYCNPNALSKSNGYEVFDFFDDFDNDQVDSWWTVENNAQWIESNGVIYSNPDTSYAVKPLRVNIGTFDNVIIEARGRWTSTNDDLGIFVYGDTLGNAYALWHGYGTPPNSQYCIASYTTYGSPSFLNCYSYNLPQGVWGRFKVLIKNNGEIYGKIWEEGSTEPPWTVSYTVTPYGYYVGIWYWDDRCYVEFDWVRVRKYTEPWPSYYAGLEETCFS